MEYPNLAEIYKLYDEYGLPINVIRHCEQVTKVAIFIAKKLIDNGYEIDLGLLKASGLLHDIAKPVDFKDFGVNKNITDFEPTKEHVIKWKKIKEITGDLRHEQAGVKLIYPMYPKVAKIIGMHGYSKVNFGFESFEEKLIYYADKIVKHDQIDTLEKRLEEGHKRYVGKRPFGPDIIETDKKIFELQSEIFDKAKIDSEDLIKLNNVGFLELYDAE